MKKFLWWLLGIALVLGIGFFVGGIYLKKNWQPLLEEQLKQAVIRSSDSLYRIEYKSLDVNPLNGNLKLTDFKLIPVMEVYENMRVGLRAPDNLYQLEVDALIIKNVNAKEAVNTKKLQVSDILINHPQLIITNRRQYYNDTVSKVKEKKDPYLLMKDILKELRVSTIALNNIDFTFINKSNPVEKRTSLKNLNIYISDVLVDSLSARDKNRIYYTRNVELILKDYRIATPDSLYYLKLDNMYFSVKRNELTLTRLKLEPRYLKNAFYKKVGYAKDRFDIDFNEISIKDVDFNKFLTQQKLYANSFYVKNGKVEVYNNNAYPKRRSNKTGKFPHQQLLKVALDMRILKLFLQNVDISYAEYDAKSGKTGKIEFKNTKGIIYNVANDSAALTKNSVMKAALQTYVFGKARLDLNINFYMKSKTGAFDYNGVVRSFDGRLVNEIVRPLGMAEINSANIDKLTFNVKANEKIATGQMNFYYKDLKVIILKKDETGKLIKLGFASKLANNLIIHESNPNKKGEFTVGRVLFVRPATMSFFAYLWQSLFTGIKESVGFSREKESAIRKNAEQLGSAVKNLKETLAQAKQKLKERREERLKRKEVKKREKESDKILKDTLNKETPF